ncbi:glycosyltransferase family 1 protein [Thiosulfatimonas sediminis]|uniref:glycosyltransferase family 1 protein n=1 Tax=Thiosulfatimonas sediminis TaxID=2675054 RepID=UPI001564396C|nr:glycosyltransferase family 1 protein [Thiosulfatimonas sediminis]
MIIIEERENPSTDYFVLPQFPLTKFDVKRCTFNQGISADLLTDAIVVFVRYLPKKWRQLVAENRVVLKSLYFFMDDDLLDLKASKGMPLRYRWKLLTLAALHKNWLLQQQAEFWVSTPYLLNKYHAYSPDLMTPKPVQALHNSVKVFYHGSASHKAEIEWLLPVMTAVLARNKNVCFEIIGGPSVYQAFKGLPRVQVIHPMGWEAYQHFIKQPGRHIGLAPLLDSAFNAARSYTKVFDITQAGAVGIYSVNSESAGFVASICSSGVIPAGLVLPLEPALWIEAILELADDVERRQLMLEQAQVRLASLACNKSKAL